MAANAEAFRGPLHCARVRTNSQIFGHFRPTARSASEPSMPQIGPQRLRARPKRESDQLEPIREHHRIVGLASMRRAGLAERAHAATDANPITRLEQLALGQQRDAELLVQLAVERHEVLGPLAFDDDPSHARVVAQHELDRAHDLGDLAGVGHSEVALADARDPGSIVDQHRRRAAERVFEQPERLDPPFDLDHFARTIERRDGSKVGALRSREQSVEPTHMPTLSRIP